MLYLERRALEKQRWEDAKNMRKEHEKERRHSNVMQMQHINDAPREERDLGKSLADALREERDLERALADTQRENEELERWINRDAKYRAKKVAEVRKKQGSLRKRIDEEGSERARASLLDMAYEDRRVQQLRLKREGKAAAEVDDGASVASLSECSTAIPDR